MDIHIHGKPVYFWHHQTAAAATTAAVRAAAAGNGLPSAVPVKMLLRRTLSLCGYINL